MTAALNIETAFRAFEKMRTHSAKLWGQSLRDTFADEFSKVFRSSAPQLVGPELQGSQKDLQFRAFALPAKGGVEEEGKRRKVFSSQHKIEVAFTSFLGSQFLYVWPSLYAYNTPRDLEKLLNSLLQEFGS